MGYCPDIGIISQEIWLHGSAGRSAAKGAASTGGSVDAWGEVRGQRVPWRGVVGGYLDHGRLCWLPVIGNPPVPSPSHRFVAPAKDTRTSG